MLPRYRGPGGHSVAPSSSSARRRSSLAVACAVAVGATVTESAGSLTTDGNWHVPRSMRPSCVTVTDVHVVKVMLPSPSLPLPRCRPEHYRHREVRGGQMLGAFAARPTGRKLVKPTDQLRTE